MKPHRIVFVVLLIIPVLATAQENLGTCAEYLERMRAKYDLPDLSKTVRILVDFAMHERDEEERIFTQMRCSGC